MDRPEDGEGGTEAPTGGAAEGDPDQLGVGGDFPRRGQVGRGERVQTGQDLRVRGETEGVARESGEAGSWLGHRAAPGLAPWGRSLFAPVTLTLERRALTSSEGRALVRTLHIYYIMACLVVVSIVGLRQRRRSR